MLFRVRRALDLWPCANEQRSAGGQPTLQQPPQHLNVFSTPAVLAQSLNAPLSDSTQWLHTHASPLHDGLYTVDECMADLHREARPGLPPLSGSQSRRKGLQMNDRLWTASAAAAHGIAQLHLGGVDEDALMP